MAITTIKPPMHLSTADVSLRPLAELPRAEAPALDILSRIQDPSTWEIGEARGPVSIGFSAEGNTARTVEQAKALRARTQEIFGKEIGLGAFERLVDAPPDSRVVIDPDGEKLTADVYSTSNPSEVLEKLTFDKQEDGSVLLTHDVSRAGAHADLAPVFGSDTIHGASIFGHPVVEQWRAAPENGTYVAELPNGTRITTMDRDGVNQAAMNIFKDPQTRGPLTKPLNAEQLNELFFLPEGGVASLTSRDPSRIDLGVKHPSFAADTRDYTVKGDGKVVFHQGIARVDSDHGQATGLGKDTFMQAMVANHKYGVDAIQAMAAGSGNGTDHVSDGSFVGYYVWPRFGFNGEISSAKRTAMPPELSGARDMLDLFSRPGGAEWWKRNGSSLNVEFLLDPNGPNVAAFQRYAAEKQAAAAARAAG